MSRMTTIDKINMLMTTYHQHSDESESLLLEITTQLSNDKHAIDHIYDRYIIKASSDDCFECAKRLIQDVAESVILPIEPLLDLINAKSVHIVYKKSLCHIIVKQFKFMDEGYIYYSIDNICAAGEEVGAIHQIISHFAKHVTGAKALSVLKRCMIYTDTQSSKEQYYIISTFVETAEQNKSYYRLALSQTSVPHEIVILAVSLLNKEYTCTDTLVILAEKAASLSHIADSYLNFYVGMYIATE